MSAEIQGLRDEIRSLRSTEIQTLAQGQTAIMVQLGKLDDLPGRVAKLEENQTSMMSSLQQTAGHHKTVGRLIERWAPWLLMVLLGGKVGADMVLPQSGLVQVVEVPAEP